MFTAAEMKVSLQDAGFTARETAMTFALRQWDLLHGEDRIHANSAINSLIDPEALFLISLGFQHIERRLSKELNWFIQHGIHLINYRRLKQLARLFPPSVSARLGTYAHLEWQHNQGGHAVKKTSLSQMAFIKGQQNIPDLSINQALLLRLRAGFGATPETDILAAIIGSNGDIGSDRIADLTGYSQEGVARRLNSMVLSRFIKTTQRDELVLYRANQAFVSSLLKQNEKAQIYPFWLSWMHIFAFLSHIENFTREEKITNVKPYVLSKEAGKIMTRNTPAFTVHGMEVEEPTLGTDYFEVFNKSVRQMTGWLNSEPIQVADLS